MEMLVVRPDHRDPSFAYRAKPHQKGRSGQVAKSDCRHFEPLRLAAKAIVWTMIVSDFGPGPAVLTVQPSDARN